MTAVWDARRDRARYAEGDPVLVRFRGVWRSAVVVRESGRDVVCDVSVGRLRFEKPIRRNNVTRPSACERVEREASA